MIKCVCRVFNHIKGQMLSFETFNDQNMWINLKFGPSPISRRGYVRGLTFWGLAVEFFSGYKKKVESFAKSFQIDNKHYYKESV